VIDQNNPRQQGPQTVLPPQLAGVLAGFMRGVVTSGTGRAANVAAMPVAGKTGTAEVTDKPSHAWFVGFAPYASPGRKIAFAVVVEHGQYGGTAAAPIAAELVAAARESGLIGATQ
jgi:penicillin-binding protein A